MTEPTNAQRAQRITALFEKSAVYGFEDGVTDMLADIMHYCKLEAHDFNNELRLAQMHYNAESGQ